MRKFFFTAVFLVMVLFAVVGWAADWYCAATGINGDGSEDSPWVGSSNIVWGAGGVQAGDTLWVLGTHVGEQLTIGSDNVIIRGDYPGNQGVIDANGNSTCIDNSDGHDGITIQSIGITGFSEYGIRSYSADNFVVKNCEFYNNVSGTSMKWVIGWDGNNCIIEGNYFHDLQSAQHVILFNHDGSGYCNTNDVDISYIRNNRFLRCDNTTSNGDGHVIALAGGTLYSRTIKHVVIENNNFDTCGNAEPNPIVSSYNAEDVIIQRNVFYNGSARAIQVGTNCKDNYVAYNLVYNSIFYEDQPSLAGVLKLGNSTGGCTECTTATNIYFVNNTIYGIDAEDSTHSRGAIVIACADDGELACDHIYVENNIVYADMPSDTSGCWELMVYDPGNRITDLYSDYNDWYRSQNTNNFIWFKGNAYSMSEFASYQSTENQDTHSFTSNPLLTSTYHLSRNSPCIDAGTKLSIHDSDWQDLAGNRQRYGTNPDIGCYERNTDFRAKWGGQHGWTSAPWGIGKWKKNRWTPYE